MNRRAFLLTGAAVLVSTPGSGNPYAAAAATPAPALPAGVTLAGPVYYGETPMGLAGLAYARMLALGDRPPGVMRRLRALADDEALILGQSRPG